MTFNKEMMAALEADGKTLRQLTGEDHGPAFFDQQVRFVQCTNCGGEGRVYSGHPNDPHPGDCGECPICKGVGMEEIPVEPITLDDLEQPQ